MLPLVPTGRVKLCIAKLAITDQISLLKFDKHEAHPITFQALPSLFRLFLWALYQMCEVKADVLGNVPPGVKGLEMIRFFFLLNHRFNHQYYNTHIIILYTIIKFLIIFLLVLLY